MMGRLVILILEFCEPSELIQVSKVSVRLKLWLHTQSLI